MILQVPPHAELTVWSAQDPLKLPVSSVLVIINFKTGQQVQQCCAHEMLHQGYLPVCESFVFVQGSTNSETSQCEGHITDSGPF